MTSGSDSGRRTPPPLSGLDKNTFSDLPGTGQEDMFEPKVEFKPLVSLPEVEVKTGEENFEKLFTDRCKLYRFDKATSEWKERGLGDLSVQKRTDTPAGKVIIRILMRWEKTLKICANHQINAGMKLEPFSAADTKSYKWFAQDFSDGEMKPELLAVRFKTKEQADKFKAVFEAAQRQVTASGDSPVKATEKPVPAVPAAAEVKPLGWGDQFKPKDGAWSCKECYSSNPADKMACAACATPKPGTAAVVSGKSSLASMLSSTAAAPAPASKFSFGGPLPGSGASETPKFGFGYQTSTTTDAKPAGNAGFSFFSKPDSTAATGTTPFAGFGLGVGSAGEWRRAFCH